MAVPTEFRPSGSASAAPDQATPEVVHTEVRYLKPELRSVAVPPRIGDRDSRRANTAKFPVAVTDARPMLTRGEIDLERQGFTLTKHTSATTDFQDPTAVEAHYYPEISDRLKLLTGATRVFITEHVVRTEDTSNFNRAYARFVHCDYAIGEPRQLAQSLLTKRGITAAPDAEFAWYNAWQPFDRPVAQNALGFIDATSLAEGDVVNYYYTGFDKPNLSAMPVFNPQHRFYYFADMQTDDLLILKQLDTRAGHAPCCPHTAFVDPGSAPDAPGRRSIEVRLFCIFD